MEFLEAVEEGFAVEHYPAAAFKAFKPDVCTCPGDFPLSAAARMRLAHCCPVPYSNSGFQCLNLNVSNRRQDHSRTIWEPLNVFSPGYSA
jgi:hypothetical protein